MLMTDIDRKTTKDYTYKNLKILIENKELVVISGDKDSTLSDLKKFQHFLRRNFKDKFTYYKDMRPVSNEPGRLYATAKTNKYNLLRQITVFKRLLYKLKAEVSFQFNYVEYLYNRRQKNTVNKLYDGLNNYHPKVKLTIETNPLRFLDKEIIHNGGMIKARVHRKKTKLQTPWTSNIP